MKSIRIFLIAAVTLAVCGLVAWYKLSPEAPATGGRMEPARIRDLKPLVELCAVEFYKDVPVKARKGERHFFGKMAMEGSVSFDLERLRSEERGDTLMVTLPEPMVTIRDSTDPEAWRVIDTWSDRFLGRSAFTASEENEIKFKVIENFRRELYADGTVARAGREARENLAGMLAALTGRPVVVKGS